MPETERKWWITFGFDHVDPKTGIALRKKYTTVEGNAEQARTIMNERFGNQWASIYAHAETQPRSMGSLRYGAGVATYQLEYFDYTI